MATRCFASIVCSYSPVNSTHLSLTSWQPIRPFWAQEARYWSSHRPFSLVQDCLHLLKGPLVSTVQLLGRLPHDAPQCNTFHLHRPFIAPLPTGILFQDAKADGLIDPGHNFISEGRYSVMKWFQTALRHLRKSSYRPMDVFSPFQLQVGIS